jgi:hypothetical protein
MKLCLSPRKRPSSRLRQFSRNHRRECTRNSDAASRSKFCLSNGGHFPWVARVFNEGNPSYTTCLNRVLKTLYEMLYEGPGATSDSSGLERGSCPDGGVDQITVQVLTPESHGPVMQLGMADPLALAELTDRFRLAVAGVPQPQVESALHGSNETGLPSTRIHSVVEARSGGNRDIALVRGKGYLNTAFARMVRPAQSFWHRPQEEVTWTFPPKE